MPEVRHNVTSVFYGINKGELIPEGYFSEMINMTSSRFPCASTRNERALMTYGEAVTAPGEPVAAVEYDDGLLVACNNGLLVYGDTVIDGRVKTTDIVPIGNKFFCSPSGCLIDIVGNTEFSGQIVSDTFSVTLCDSAFEDIDVTHGDKPQEPSNGQYWYDGENKSLYRYSSVNESWVAASVIYTKLGCSSVDLSPFKKGDGVRVKSGEKYIDSFVANVFSDSIVIEGIHEYLTEAEGSEGIELEISRRFPTLQYACVHNNRIWGCNFDGVLNEIYASKLGDPLNFYCYRGLSTDSYAVSCGEPGVFTGCSELGDTVIFFKENCMYTIYGTEPSAYQTIKTDCFGVQKGSEKSIVRINGHLYYKSCHGIMRLSESSLPVLISDELGPDIWRDAVAGTDGRKYYIVMTDNKDNRSMYVYDTQYEVWHKEDIPCEGLFTFMTYKNNLLCIGKTETETKAKSVRVSVKEPEGAPKQEDYENYYAWLEAFLVWFAETAIELIKRNQLFQKTDEELREVLAESQGKTPQDISNEELREYLESIFEYKDTFVHELSFSYITNELTCNAYLPVVNASEAIRQDEGRFMWSFDTGLRAYEITESKRITGVDIRMKLLPGARCSISVQYDENGKWEDITSFDDPGMRTFRFSGRLNKCDVYRLRFHGYGQMILYSITDTYEEAGNIGF